MQEVKLKFNKDLKNKLLNAKKDNAISDVVFLCIGTDRITGDSFGPIVGYKIAPFFKSAKNISVVGDLETIVSFSNLSEHVKQIYKRYKKPFIIAIDSAISKDENVGKIFVEEGGLKSGNGLGKCGVLIGDMTIKAVVARKVDKPKENFIILQNTSLGMVMNLADVVAKGILENMNILDEIGKNTTMKVGGKDGAKSKK